MVDILKSFQEKEQDSPGEVREMKLGLSNIEDLDIMHLTDRQQRVLHFNSSIKRWLSRHLDFGIWLLLSMI